MTTKTSPFENNVCSRCCGTGQYSFNLMHGTRCYGCNGAGFKLTARGAAARKWLIEQRSVRADQIKVGQRMQFDFYFWAGWKEVTEAEVCPNGQVKLSCLRRGETNTTYVSADAMIAVAVSTERMAELTEQALAYQATLNKDGTPSKRSRKA